MFYMHIMILCKSLLYCYKNLIDLHDNQNSILFFSHANNNICTKLLIFAWFGLRMKLRCFFLIRYELLILT